MTFSIVARDPASGQLGGATQSQAFAVGTSVLWAAPGVGVVVTQSMGEPMYGELGLGGLRAGLTAREALTALRAVDPHPERRQVAMVDRAGEVAVATGQACVAAAGHRVGDGVVAAANLMATDGVWDAMVEAYEATDGEIAVRLLAAMAAAEAAGGDLRGRRSAALHVVCAEPSGRPWRDHLVELRVDDHPDPLAELDRMLGYTDRYHRTAAGFELALDGDGAGAAAAVADLHLDVDTEPELALWRAVIALVDGEEEAARAVVADLQRTAPELVEAARRFGPAGLIDPALLARMLPS